MIPLAEMACKVLMTPDGRDKTALSRNFAAQWFEKRHADMPVEIGDCKPPSFPARPTRPDLLTPRDVPKRKPGTQIGRIALLHAVAHIELNAVDLHWDLIARFTDTTMPVSYTHLTLPTIYSV